MEFERIFAIFQVKNEILFFMENDPKYKVNQKVWFLTENERICYGTITSIRPVNYDFNYSIKLVLDSVGEVMKNAVWENDILGDFTDDIHEICYNVVGNSFACEVNNQIVKSLVADQYIDDNKLNCKTIVDISEKHIEGFHNKYNNYRMGTVEPTYIFGLERDFGIQCDLAFILGAIEKYGRVEGYYTDLAGYILRMTIQMIEDMRTDVNNKEKEEKS